MASLSRQQWRTVGKLVAALVATGVLAAGLLLPYVGGVGLAAGHEANKFLATSCNITESKPPEPTTIYARDGKTVIARVFTQDREPISLSQVPKYLQQALIATEDRRFYSHHGVDMRGLVRSAVSTSGGSTQGGSTLTMQYVKQVRYFQASEIQDPTKQKQAQDDAIVQDLNRKIQDAKCALYFENTLHESKDQILENYLNIAFFGENAFGIQRAAETYFSKPASQLTLPESAMLVGILRAPSTYDPFTNRAAATERRNEVIQNLVAVGDLSPTDAAKYEALPVQLSTQTPPQVHQGCANSGSSIPNVGFFCDYVTQWLRDTNGIEDLASGGYDVITTLDPKVQTNAQKGISQTVPANSPMTEVLPVLDPKTGDVLAMATSKMYGNPTSSKDKTHTSLHIFTDYIANGSSTYKLFPLLAALSVGVPADWKLETPTNNGGKYVPQNCSTNAGVSNDDSGNEHFDSNETLATATAKSSNTYFVGLADQLLQCNLQPILDVATKLGMKSLLQRPDGKSTVAQTIVQYQRAAQLVLGDVGTSPLEITGAYAAVANDGIYNAAAPVLSIKQEGRVVAVKRSPGVQAVAPQVARQAVDILTGDTTSVGTSASKFTSWYASNPSQIAGKTGTAVAVVNGKDTKQNSSLWFVGLTRDYVATSALIDFDSPFAPLSGLPGTDATHAYGAYASGVWLAALQATIKPETWTWQSPDAVDGSKVPDVAGKEPGDAKRELTAAGYKVAMLGGTTNPIACASNVEFGKIAYYGPHIAPKGTTITLCPSLGFPQQVAPPPPPETFVPQPTNHSTGHSQPSHSASPPPTTHSRGSGSGTGTRTGTGNGHGHGNGNGHGHGH